MTKTVTKWLVQRQCNEFGVVNRQDVLSYQKKRGAYGTIEWTYISCTVCEIYEEDAKKKKILTTLFQCSMVFMSTASKKLQYFGNYLWLKAHQDTT